MSITFEIIVVVFLVLLNGCFAMSELAIVSSRRARLAAMASEGNRRAEKAMALAEHPGKFLSAVQTGITLIGILAGAYSGATLAGPLAEEIARIPQLAGFAHALSIALVVGGITYASLIFGELVPKQIALAAPERVSVLVAGPMWAIARAVSPMVWILEGSSRFVLRMLGIRKAEQTVTEEEVKAMIAEGTESGVFEPEEQELIAGVIRFGNRRVRALMTPRNEITWIDVGWPRERIVETIRSSPHSRLPVCEGSPDNVIGVIQAKDLLNVLLGPETLDIAKAVKPVPVVHDHAPALYVLDILKQSPIHLALVVDEYGSLEGIVTAADVLGAILGSLAEHGEEYEPVLVMREDGSWLLDGDVPVDLAAERLGCKLLAQDGDYTTIAGFILSKSRMIPSTGDYFVWDGWRFEVVDMDGLRIDKVLVSKAPAEKSPTSSD